MDPNLQLMVSDHSLMVQRLKRELQKLAAVYGRWNIWTTEELQERFEIISCCGPYCAVKERLTGKSGVMELRKHVGFIEWPGLEADAQ